MKTSRLLVAAVALMAIGMLAASARAGIVGSAHDFSSSGWSTGEICKPCHTPHFAVSTDGAPLWNHAETSSTFTLFDNAAGDLDTNSKLCMGCHDGTVALDSFGGNTGTTFISATANIGTDLTNDHPVGAAAPYPTATYMVDKTLFTTAHILPLRQIDGVDVVGCTTCHEPHNRKSTDHLLWVPNTGEVTTPDGRVVPGSGLCLSCHKK